MTSFGPIFGDYAIASCCGVWLAMSIYDAVHEVRATVRQWRQRKADRLIRIGNPTYGGSV